MGVRSCKEKSCNGGIYNYVIKGYYLMTTYD